jgi:alpha-galactosidase
MLKEKTAALDLKNWKAPELKEDMPHGDMPGDKIAIGDDHVNKANKIFPLLIEEIRKNGSDKVVVSVFGGSGVGKSEIASLLTYYLQESGIGAYVLSGDNYPYRIPLYNDAERLSIFRAAGLRGLVDAKLFNDEVKEVLFKLWADETDPDLSKANEYPWLEVYQKAGRKALKGYLGTTKEQNYDEVNQIIDEFQKGNEKIYLKRMGRKEEERWYDEVDFSDKDVLVIEWTHGGNENLKGIDIPILLNSTPEETMAHRRLRARDGKVDSAFTTMVLSVEQEELDDRGRFAKIRISKAGEIME